MPHRFLIRQLGTLPWPHGLGKNARPGHPYRTLDTELRNYLGDRCADRAAHQRAYETADPEYRRIVVDALTQMPWSTDLLDDVEAATTLARSAPPPQSTPTRRPIPLGRLGQTPLQRKRIHPQLARMPCGHRTPAHHRRPPPDRIPAVASLARLRSPGAIYSVKSPGTSVAEICCAATYSIVDYWLQGGDQRETT